MPDTLNSKLLAFIAGLISASFGAGITFAVWNSSHPSSNEIAIALGCENPLVACPAAKDAKEARIASMALREDIKELRKDLAKGFGRCLVPNIYVRDDGGKAAARAFQAALAAGVPPADAFKSIVEGDFP